MRSLFTAATGMEAQQLRIDAIANNLANSTTTGFKKWRPEFHDLFYEVLQAPGASSASGATLPAGAQIGHGVKNAGVSRIFTQGDRTNTGAPLDLAIDGRGFFQIQKPGGETVYTRDGAFRRDRDGNLVSSQGYLLLPNIQVPADALDITVVEDGTVSVQLPGQTIPAQLGQLELVRFANPSGLRALGGNLFSPTDASGDPEVGLAGVEGFGGLTQGFLESSNVNVAEELVNMILAQRSFELNSRVIQAGDEMLQTVANVTR
ncbi:MAG: flagellar basal-body rod protein FlgG [Myxococcota bacterium]|nr:flagellar basal-body rod protein FlgG [Myxococcota bacterium]